MQANLTNPPQIGLLQVLKQHRLASQMLSTAHPKQEILHQLRDRIQQYQGTMTAIDAHGWVEKTARTTVRTKRAGQCTNCVHLQSAIARRQRFRLHNTLQKLFQLPTPTRYKVRGGAKYCLGRNVLHSVLGTLADQLRCINIKFKRQASAGSEMRWILPFDAI